MQGFQMLADIIELAAPDIRAQARREAGQIVQRDADGDAVGSGGNPDFVVRRGHLDGEADDLPGRAQPLHDQ